MAAVGSSQLIEQPDEQIVVPALPDHPVESPRGEVERPADPHLAVSPRSAEVLLFSFTHPAQAHFGVGLQLGYTSWKKEPASSVICRTSKSLARFSLICSSESFSGGTGRGLLQRKPSLCSARRSVSRLTRVARSLKSWRASSLQLQRERNQPCSVGESSSSSFWTRSFAALPSNGFGPRLRRSSKAARPSRTNRSTME